MRGKLNFKPYKIPTSQNLTLEHQIKLLNFAERFLGKFETDRSFLDSIIFSNEAYFSLSGMVNRQNMRFRSDEKPNIAEIKQCDAKVMV